MLRDGKSRIRKTLLKNILIVKHGALGDVVRTSYFANSLKYEKKVKIYWLTSPHCLDLLNCNPNIDYIVTNYFELANIHFDQIFSLDDEIWALKKLLIMSTSELIGAYLDNGKINYTENTSEWFDMGLISNYGLKKANKLKKQNKKTHSQIFASIFRVSNIYPEFFPNFSKDVNQIRSIGLISSAGERWPSKSLNQNIKVELISLILDDPMISSSFEKLVLFGEGKNYEDNKSICEKVQSNRIDYINTEKNIQLYAKEIKNCSLIITADTLGLHLAIAQKIPHVAFFAPTSSSEIDSFGIPNRHIIETSNAYCSYNPNSSNKTITANRIIKAIRELIEELRNG